MLNKTGKSEEQRTGTSLGCRDSIPASQVSRIGPSDDQQYFKNSSAQGSGSALGHQPNEVPKSHLYIVIAMSEILLLVFNYDVGMVIL